jgi:hypothetical protein
MSGPWEKYSQPEVSDGPWAKYSPTEQPKTPEGTSFGQHAGNLLGGLVRGAGSIGATLMAPIDIGKDALAGKGLSLESNRQRRKDMDAGLESLGAQPDSLIYQGGKLTGEIAGTAGVPGLVAKGAHFTDEGFEDP